MGKSQARSQARSLWPAVLSALVGARCGRMAERNTAMRIYTAEEKRIAQQLVRQVQALARIALRNSLPITGRLQDIADDLKKIVGSHPSLEETREK